MKILAITSCPNGIAHTYMAQEKLEQAAASLNVDIKVETQGGIGVENELTSEEIKEADGIIIAADRNVDVSRFHGKPLIQTNVREGIHHPEKLIQQIIDGKAQVYHAENHDSGQTSRNKANGGVGAIYQHLMNGVSFMVPFIVVGGLLIAIALSLGGEATPQGLKIPDGSFFQQLEKIGGLSFKFMVPILAGYIAYSIADKPGLVPGMIGGAIAADGSFYGTAAQAGFLGGIVAGFLAGYIALAIKSIKVPKAVAPIMPIIVIPIISSVIVGLLFIYVLGAPIAGIFEGLTHWLKGMQGANIVILAAIIGAMIAFDMGGPVNKVAFLFGSALIAEGNYAIMGMVAVAVCTPPIGLGIATFINKVKFTKQEHEMGKASFAMGLFGITEGAIPFAAQDPLRVIPANIIGAVVASIIAAIAGVGDRVAHGGPIVAVVGGIDHILMFFVAVIIGSLVTAFTVILVKKPAVMAPDLATATTNVSSTDIKTTTDTPSNEENDIENTEELFKKSLINIENKVFQRDDAIEFLIENLAKEKYISDNEAFKEAILARESQSTTALGMQIAMPHAKSSAVKTPVVAVLKNNQDIDWESLDGTKPRLVFMIAVPEKGSDVHLKILQRLSKALMNDEFRNKLLQAESVESIYKELETI